MPSFRGGLVLLIFCWSAAAFGQTRPAKPDTAAAKHYTYTETMPEFPGGQPRLLALIRDSLRYPPQALRDGLQGKVIMAFTVDATGAFTNLTVKQGLRADLDAEALRLLRQLAPIRWQPGTQNGRPVAVQYTVPVTFSINHESQPLQPDSLDAAPGPTIVLPSRSWPGGRTSLPADKGVIYGSCVQRLGFSSGGLGQYVRLQNLTTHKVVRILVKPVMRSRPENEFCVALPPGRAALYSYEYSYGVEQVRKLHNGPALADTRYTFEVRPGQLHYVGTWDFRQPFQPRFQRDKATLDQLLQAANPGLPLAEALETLPK
ncbi:energy transducer TonB [Hymenobacter chitinivorans]|uniref:TonB family protein n=1 Tax=Hymenobacter chitinivorans DSM 11115 TaxID=1121954 RepID=A0A2M9BMR7_9BACT|nr:energy transducer TonB [Hymenobacter chitinivorans]PJJ59253.1 TonB family protein [Hymenobacter chitinivorans DSM 11115]